MADDVRLSTHGLFAFIRGEKWTVPGVALDVLEERLRDGTVDEADLRAAAYAIADYRRLIAASSARRAMVVSELEHAARALAGRSELQERGRAEIERRRARRQEASRG